MTENLPVRRLVLYKHGVGYVERAGPVEGRTFHLEFRREDMDDVLKSLLVADRAGGRVTGISYDSAEDIEETIAKRALVPPEKEALIGLLRKLPGYRVSVKTTSDQVSGEIVGTDEGEVLGQAEVAVPNPKVVLRDGEGRLVPVPIREVVQLQILDGAASDDLQYFLRLVTAERKKDRRGVTIHLEGERHDLSVGYLTSAPSWRVSYRLDRQQATTWLQAWGVVDNWLEEDLREVALSLVAGKPISFVYDIYVPRSVPRPVVREEVRALDSPVELEPTAEPADQEAGELMEGFGQAAPAPAAPMGMMHAAMKARRSASMPTEVQPPPPPPLGGTAKVETKTVEGGDSFRYDVLAPTTVPRGQSALVPILQIEVRSERVLVYNRNKVPGNPVAVLQWRNMGAVLERGPVVVLEEGTYAGEGILPYTGIDGESKVAFAVDLGVKVAEEVQTSELTIGLVIDRTYARREQKQRRQTTYTIDNRKTEAVDLIIEHPRTPGAKLVEPPKPEEETAELRRFKLAVKPKSRTSLVVREERVDSVSQATSNFGLPLMEAVLGEGELAAAPAQHLRQLVEVTKEKARLERSVAKLQQSRGTLAGEQNRVRGNLATVLSSQNKALQTRYTEELQGLEQRLVDLLAEEDRLQKLIADREKRVDELIDSWPQAAPA